MFLDTRIIRSLLYDNDFDFHEPHVTRFMSQIQMMLEWILGVGGGGSLVLGVLDNHLAVQYLPYKASGL